jgi:uncharacterized protein
MSHSRRDFIARGAAAAAFSGLAACADAAPGADYVNEAVGYGPLVEDPKGLFDLPKGFSYRIVSQAGQTMNDGLLTPGKMDGMGCFAAGAGRVALVRNHEIGPRDIERTAFGPGRALAGKIPAELIYDRDDSGLPMGGGTTTLVWDLRAGRLVSHHLSLAGTVTNCAGGVTPRGSWYSCEETTQAKGQEAGKDHGWVFEVPASSRGLVVPRPIVGMGRFRHEAAATDPRTGIVYLTEDLMDGLIYRYLPGDPARPAAGGRLQALGLRADPESDLRNHDEIVWRQGDSRQVSWIDVDGVDNPYDDLRHRGRAKGAARFARGEGLFFGERDLFISATSGGPRGYGQILRYSLSPDEGRPSERDRPGNLQLFIEPKDPTVMYMADNISVAPWGHLFVCEDKTEGRNMLKAVTPGGKTYTVGRNPAQPSVLDASNTELAGVCFSPDGSTMFVNLYLPGATLAVTGPWRSVRT